MCVCVYQSYCLKVKEMDDEEYSCIVSSCAHLYSLITKSQAV